jgi:hypothetical protein
MDEDDPLPLARRPTAAETLEAASARLKPAPRVDGSLFRVVEVMRAPNGRVQRVGQIWHSDLSRVRRFGHALAGNTSGQRVQVADAGGQVIETIPAPPPGTPPTGWGNWQATVLPPAPPRPPSPPRPAAPPAPKPPPTMVPPIIPQALPATLAPAVPKPPRDLPVMPPENAVERTNPLPPTHV